ncbi:MAG: hypothetical protein LAT52_07695, partial [Balneolales bacterium]|nr:hypothetical protein [Balneolales bacterium]
GDSDYTDRLIQTGMMREDAIIRSVQDLNHRLVSFFADYGIACIGINGFQRGTVKRTEDGDIKINTSYLKSLPEGTVIVLSSLIKDLNNEYEVIPLPTLARAVQRQLEPGQTHLFSVDSADEIILNHSISSDKAIKWSEIKGSDIGDKIPTEFSENHIQATLCKPLYNNNLKSFEVLADITS